jgi:hypothetical protein
MKEIADSRLGKKKLKKKTFLDNSNKDRGNKHNLRRFLKKKKKFRRRPGFEPVPPSLRHI